jgi:hypothetical protein
MFLEGVSNSIKGIPKAAVLPVQVSACHIMFFSLAKSNGITWLCISDGVSNHFFANASNVLLVSQSTLKASKFVILVLKL